MRLKDYLLDMQTLNEEEYKELKKLISHKNNGDD